MNIVQPWKRFMAVGCSHGIYADPLATEAVLRFREQYAPHEMIHLGDFTDMSPFMGGAGGDGDPIKPDLQGGVEFLTQLQATTILCGNHEARLWRDRLSHNQLKALAAETCIEAIEVTALKLHARLIPYIGVFQAFQLGDYKFTHGTIYNENSARDMAETYGNVIFAHTHKASIQAGRTFHPTRGISVGTLTRRGAMEYANTRKSTLAWSQGFVYGEYCDNSLQPTLHIHDGTDTWKLPK
jgi:predicted phosphodiesterase